MNKFLVKVYLTALVLRLLMVWIYSIVQPEYPDRNYFFQQENEIWWHGSAVAILQGKPLEDYETLGQHAIIERQGNTRSGYAYYLALIYKFVGINPNRAKAVQVLWASLIPVYIYLIGRKLINERAGRIAAWLDVFYPFSIWYSAIFYKEVFCSFLLILIFWNGLRLTERFSWRATIQFALASGILIFTRTQMVALAWLILGIYLFYIRRISVRMAFRVCMMLCAFIVTIYILPITNRVANREILQTLPRKFIALYDRRVLEDEREVYDTTLIDKFERDPLFLFSSHTLGGLAALFVYPPPWDASTERFIIPNLGSFFHWALWPAFFYGLYICWKKRRNGSSFVLVYAVFIIVLHLLLGTTGASDRHRLQLMPILFIPAAVGFQYFPRLKEIYLIYGFAAVTLTWFLWDMKLGEPLWLPLIPVLVFMVVWISKYPLCLRGRGACPPSAEVRG